MATPETWHLIFHSAGPAADLSTPRSRQPWFASHRDFHESLEAEGLLVAGGSVPAADVTGITLVRGLTTAELEARIAADEGVAGGHLAVEVRPWVVTASVLPPLA